MHPYHTEILAQIRKHSGKPTQDAFLTGYLGNNHPRYPINAPTLRKLAKDWMKAHKDLSPGAFTKVLSSLAAGKSFTEKIMVGTLLDYTAPAQRKFNPALFDAWLDHMEGWAEVDSTCTGSYHAAEIPVDWARWRKVLTRLSKSKNINKRRASLVLLCSPIRLKKDTRLLKTAFDHIDKLKGEKEVLITKAISWILRNAVNHHRDEVRKYVALTKDTLPSIAVRETMTVLKTGKKTKSKTTKS